MLWNHTLYCLITKDLIILEQVFGARCLSPIDPTNWYLVPYQHLEVYHEGYWFTLQYIPRMEVRYHYKAANFLQNPHNKFPWGWDIGCLLHVLILIRILGNAWVTLQWHVSYGISCFIGPRYKGMVYIALQVQSNYHTDHRSIISICIEMNCLNANFVVPGDTAGCRSDNLQCHQGRQSWHHDDSWFSM